MFRAVVSVSARDTITDTAVEIPSGHAAHVRPLAGHYWVTHLATGRCGVGGNGQGAKKRAGYLAPEGDEGCMWGTADNGRDTVMHWFARGDDNGVMVVPGPGRLKLGPNDDNLADNSYDIPVSIELKLIKRKSA